ncbi:PAS domain S-box protein [Halobacillus sp. KCTC 3957]|uniref:PAS domain S-box protein n=2 Tax=Halobacillus yeomjeoni TaxID=311194 RepID=A0A931MU05_9BACI|nr:PAS domain S-box protein [Halobacillus yeomjeoni]
MYRKIVEYSFETTIIHSNQQVLYINEAGSEFLRSSKEAIIGANIVDVFPDEYKDFIVERIRKGTFENKVGELIETKVFRFDGTICEVELYCHPVLFGKTKAIQSIIRDITPRKETERRLKKVIGEVSTPLVPVADEIAVLPLVGVIDETRAEQLLELIPAKTQQYPLRYLIVDVSGIYNIDHVVAEFLFNINAIVELLGISLIYTGLRPELAHKAIEARSDITSLKTMATVQQALKRLSNAG